MISSHFYKISILNKGNDNKYLFFRFFQIMFKEQENLQKLLSGNRAIQYSSLHSISEQRNKSLIGVLFISTPVGKKFGKGIKN